ncbi:phage portal protein [Clostridium felsineum]|uniref:phage portal protein n=1 Tax=Clostridium felsineum TaxID=36839 RepID=UPI00214DC209|nr:phage portal protein [Clostridium felsineum]MCR3760411.1 phage portal protein [Clostridium felsineum]
MDIVRFDIQTYDADTIRALINYHKEHLLPRYNKLQSYYNYKHEILNRVNEDKNKPNNRLVNDYPGYIVNLATGYFIGNPVTYSSDCDTNEDYLQSLKDIFDYNDEADENIEIAKTCSIKGEAFELIYIDDDGNTRFKQVPNEQILLVYDNSIDPNPICAVRYYSLSEPTAYGQDEVLPITKVEVYNQDFINYYDDYLGELTLTDQKENLFKEVPVIHFKNNYELTGDFECVISLIDAYDSMQSDTMNDFDYFTDAYLMLKGMSGTDPEDVKEMKKNRVILVDENGDANWLVKDINDTATENFKKRLKDDIHKFSKTPDLEDEKFSGNLSGIAVKFKLFCLEQLAVVKERKFKKALQRRNELITNMLNLKGSKYDYTSIDTTFTRNIPANLVDIATVVNQLRGMVSNETLLAQLPFVTDVQEEMEKVKQEQEENPSVNLDNVPSRDTGGDASGQQSVLDEQNPADSTQYLQQSRTKESETTAGV